MGCATSTLVLASPFGQQDPWDIGPISGYRRTQISTAPFCGPYHPNAHALFRGGIKDIS
jgi:hypothetical protein